MKPVELVMGRQTVCKWSKSILWLLTVIWFDLWLYCVKKLFIYCFMRIKSRVIHWSTWQQCVYHVESCVGRKLKNLKISYDFLSLVTFVVDLHPWIHDIITKTLNMNPPDTKPHYCHARRSLINFFTPFLFYIQMSKK